jgi:hypothetical protein
MSLLKKGNAKIDKSCLVFNLPTSVCPVQCPGCYAEKAEKRFPAVKVSRDRNYNASLDHINFIVTILSEINKSKLTKCRIHESGDFYSQQYVNVWYNIISNQPDVQFYAYTKREQDFNFEPLKALPNMNLINSITPTGLNYGDLDYCINLVEKFGYTLCPCAKGVHVDCMLECTSCLRVDKVCFQKH